MSQETAEEMVKPPFPDKMTFREMLTNLFNTDFLTEEELNTICDAGEMYANGCLKHEGERLEQITESNKNQWRSSKK